MRKIYIILMDTNTMPSRLIKIFTRYEYSHVGLSFSANCNTIYSFGRKKVNSPFDGGFVVEHKGGEFFKKFYKTRCSIYEVNVSDKKYLELKKIIREMKKRKEDYKYDFFGIILRYFNIPITFKDRYVCSYFVAQVLKDAEIYDFDKKTCFVRPRDFDGIDIFTEIYRGNYILYR